MIHASRLWSTVSEPLRIDVLGRTWTTRIPAIDAWSAVVILHPFENEHCQPLRWSEADKSRSVDEIERTTVLGRFAPTTGELDAAQAATLLQILCPAPTKVSLAFHADVLLTPSSPHTFGQRDLEGRIRTPESELLCADRHRFLLSQFTGTSSELLESLRDTHGWIEWPGLMWSRDGTWMIDSHMDVPFSVIVGDERTIGQISSCSDLDTITAGRR